MRLHAESNLRSLINVYLNGKKEPEVVEVFIPGNVLEGRGYVVRMVKENGKTIATCETKKPLPPGRYDDNGALCEKVFGQVQVEIADDASRFEDQ